MLLSFSLNQFVFQQQAPETKTWTINKGRYLQLQRFIHQSEEKQRLHSSNTSEIRAFSSHTAVLKSKETSQHASCRPPLHRLRSMTAPAWKTWLVWSCTHKSVLTHTRREDHKHMRMLDVCVCEPETHSSSPARVSITAFVPAQPACLCLMTFSCFWAESALCPSLPPLPGSLRALSLPHPPNLHV